MKVLYIQHVSVIGGSSKSMLELITNLPKNIEVEVLCPPGEYSELLKTYGIKVHTVIGVPQFNNTMISRYKGLRWLILLRELFYIPFFTLKIFTLRKEKFDIVHLNDITHVYGLILSKVFLGKTVMHVRAMMSTEKNLRYKILLKIFKEYADRIIAIDETVKSTLDYSLDVSVIHNGISKEKINMKNMERKTFTVGIVANFQRYKGIVEFIDAANIIIHKKKLNIVFVVYGGSYSNTKSMKSRILQLFGFHEDLEAIFKQKLEMYSLKSNLFLQGYVEHSDDIYNNIDLLTFPSHLNAVGRPVFEAGFYKVPSIVAIKDPFDDTIIDNITGICIDQKNPIALSDAIEKLYWDRDLLTSMGEASYNNVHLLFDSYINSQKVYQVYKEII